MKMNTFMAENLTDALKGYKILEESEDYKILIKRRFELKAQISTMVDEIFENRHSPEKIKSIKEAKVVVDASLNEINNSISEMRNGVNDALQLKLKMKMCEKFDEFLK